MARSERRTDRRVMEFDSRSFSFGRVRRSAGKAVGFLVKYIFSTLLAAVLVYVVFAIFFRTDTERSLRREIRMYERLYPDLAPRAELIKDAVAGLQHKDNEIYEQIFHTSAPDIDPSGRLSFLNASDTIPASRLDEYARDKSDSLLAVAADVEASFRKIFDSLRDSALVMPPMKLPLEDISFPQIGASVGSRLDPFFKAYVWHEGLDFIVLRGTPVYASGDGVVTASGSTKRSGNSVEISHADGYVSVYSHLESRSVRTGQTVKSGQQIGTVGMSGRSFAPHLHYELHRGDETLDPINYFFGSVTPADYANMLYMSANTRQSMD